MNENKNPSPEDFPAEDVEMAGIDSSNEYSIQERELRDRERLWHISSGAEGEDVEAVIELFQFAFCLSKKFSDEIESRQETSLDRLMLASLLRPIEYLLGNENAMRAAFGIPPKRKGTGKSSKTKEVHKKLTERIYSYMADDNTLTFAQAKNRVLEDINDAKGIRTLERAIKDHWDEVILKEDTERIKKILEERHRGKQKQQ